MIRLNPREHAQVAAALRFWGRTMETSGTGFLPHQHPLCQRRFKEHLPMTLDEIETLIGRLDGQITRRKRRIWSPEKYQ